MLSDAQIEAASIPLDYSNRQKLLKIHVNLAKRAFFPTFSGKVDYISSNLPSYTDIVKSPMSLTFLRHNLITLRYFFLIDYLRDAVLIHCNCTNFVKQSGTVNIQEVADEMINCLLQQVISAFNLRLSIKETLELGANHHFRCCTTFNYDIDITNLQQLIQGMNPYDYAYLVRDYGGYITELSIEKLLLLEYQVMSKVFECD